MTTKLLYPREAKCSATLVPSFVTITFWYPPPGKMIMTLPVRRTGEVGATKTIGGSGADGGEGKGVWVHGTVAGENALIKKHSSEWCKKAFLVLPLCAPPPPAHPAPLAPRSL